MASAVVDHDEGAPLLRDTPLHDVSSSDDSPMSMDNEYDAKAYWIMMLLGVGLLLPWNVALNSLDYMGHNYTFNLSYYVTLAYVYPQLPLLAVMVKVRGEGSGRAALPVRGGCARPHRGSAPLCSFCVSRGSGETGCRTPFASPACSSWRVRACC